MLMAIMFFGLLLAMLADRDLLAIYVASGIVHM